MALFTRQAKGVQPLSDVYDSGKVASMANFTEAMAKRIGPLRGARRRPLERAAAGGAHARRPAVADAWARPRRAAVVSKLSGAVVTRQLPRRQLGEGEVAAPRTAPVSVSRRVLLAN